MTYMLLLYCLIVIYGIRFRKDNDYLSKNQTTCVKGIFALMIVLSHFRQYIDVSNLKIYDTFLNFFGQRMVGIFFFYSGYGILESIKSKKIYMNNFLTNRFLKTLIHFDFAILLYILIALISGKNYSITTYILSLIGLKSIGNSTWFVFVILALYLITYISYKITKNMNLKRFIFTAFLFSILLILALIPFQNKQWYNIIMCYPLGLYYSYYKSTIDKYLRKYKYLILGITSTLFLVLFIFRKYLIVFELVACLFCLIIINLTYIFKIENKVLYFLGVYSFEIYILQRIPFNILNGYINNTVLYFSISVVLTIIISVGFKYIEKYIDNKLFNRKSES